MPVGRKYGHIGLIMKDTIYTIPMAETPWVDPTEPGTRPTISTNATVSYRKQGNEKHSELRRTYENYITMDERIKH